MRSQQKLDAQKTIKSPGASARTRKRRKYFDEQDESTRARRR